MSRISEAAMSDLAGLTARYPRLIHTDRTRPLLLVGICLAFFATMVGGFAMLDIQWARFLNGFGELWRILGLMLPPDYVSTARLLLWTKALGETLAIAFLGTLLAALIAFPFSLLAASNVMPNWLLRFTVRRGLDSVRGVNTLIWALIWINVVGLGPFAGVLAIMTSDIGTFGKLFSEAMEAADDKAGEGVIATGGGELHRVRFGLIPQVMPILLGQVLYLMESNTRSATIIGIVGAGGIGQHLTEQIRTLEWQQVSFLVFMVLVAVAAIDFVSSRLRSSIIGKPAGADVST